MKTILLTGASGRIGRCLRFALRDDYYLILFNRSTIEDLGPTERLIRGDTTDASAVEAAAIGVDAIVDMAAVSDEASFREKLLPSNMLGTYNVFEAARANHVPRVIYASTHHVIGYYPAEQRLDVHVPYRPSARCTPSRSVLLRPRDDCTLTRQVSRSSVFVSASSRIVHLRSGTSRSG